MSSNRMVIATLLIASLFFISPALACNYPGPSGSSISVTVYASDGKTPLPGATVSIENDSNSNTISNIEQTNSNGYIRFTPNSIQNGITYKVHATYGGDEISVESTNGLVRCVQHSVDSDPFTLRENEAMPITLTMPGVTVVHGGDATPTTCPTECPTATPVPANGPHSPYPPMDPGMSPGTVYGSVILNESSSPVNGAYVAIVSSADSNVVYSYTYTDCDGFYQILNVNSTSKAEYEIYVTDSCGDKAYSEPFVVGSGDSARVDVTLGNKDKATCTVTTEPTVTVAPTVLPVNDTTTPTPTTTDVSTDHSADLTVQHNNPGIISQITSLIGSIISSILPK